MYFVFIALEKVTGMDKFFAKNYLTSIPGRIYTIFFVMMGWVFFRAESVGDAFYYIGSMFGNGGISSDNAVFWIKETRIFFLLAILFSSPIGRWFKIKFQNNKIAQVTYLIGMVLLFVITLSFVITDSYNPFIYFNF